MYIRNRVSMGIKMGKVGWYGIDPNGIFSFNRTLFCIYMIFMDISCIPITLNMNSVPSVSLI